MGAGQRGPAPAVRGALGRLSRPLYFGARAAAPERPRGRSVHCPRKLSQTEGGLPAVSGSAPPTPHGTGRGSSASARPVFSAHHRRLRRDSCPGPARHPPRPLRCPSTSAAGANATSARSGRLAIGRSGRTARSGRAGARGNPLRIVGNVVLWPPRGRGRA